MSLLDKIAVAVTKATLAADLWFDCTLHRMAITQDDSGDTAMVTTEIGCKGIVQTASYRQQQNDGYIAGSVGILILRATIDSPDKSAKTDDEFTCLGGPYAGKRWKLYGRGGDPAGATVELLGKS